MFDNDVRWFKCDCCDVTFTLYVALNSLISDKIILWRQTPSNMANIAHWSRSLERHGHLQPWRHGDQDYEYSTQATDFMTSVGPSPVVLGRACHRRPRDVSCDNFQFVIGPESWYSSLIGLRAWRVTSALIEWALLCDCAIVVSHQVLI